MRMPDRVLESRRDQRDRGRYRLEKWLAGGRSGSVMTHLEHVRAKIRARPQQLRLDAALHVPGQQERSRAIGEAQDQGIVVARLFGNIILSGGEDFHYGPGVIHRAGWMLFSGG